MKKSFLFFVFFCMGYVANDILRDSDIKLIDKVNAEVAGMNYYDLRRDRDFKKAVRYIVENCSVSGHVSGDYLHNTSISC